MRSILAPKPPHPAATATIRPMARAIGVDVGGSAIKAGPVDTANGHLTAERTKVETPQPSTPDAVIDAIVEVVRQIDAASGTSGCPVGVDVPAVVVGGVVRTAANIDQGWVEFPAEERLAAALGRPLVLLNDADAAGLAEMRFGAGRDRSATVVALTLGTGVGSAIFVDGRLVPNTELGHMEIRGLDAERRSAAVARVRDGLSWEAWAANLDEHLGAIHRLFWPQLFILGGGVSSDAERFMPLLTVPCEIVPATLRNDAGIVGAAVVAAEPHAAGSATAARRNVAQEGAPARPAACDGATDQSPVAR
jgi:polyphosphate glucokinase